jgi:hypothetical protein
MKDVTGFDGDLQMFRERPKPVNLAHLRFLRWLIEQGRLDDLPAQSPGVELTETMLADAVPVKARQVL